MRYSPNWSICWTFCGTLRFARRYHNVCAGRGRWFPLDRWFPVIEIRAESAHGILTTTLTTKEAHVGAKYGRWRTHDGTGLLDMDTGGHDSVELENRQG